MDENQAQPPTSSNTWQDVLDEVREWQKPTQEQGYPVWYRGQSDEAWFARSGLHRHILNCFEQVGISHDQPWAIDLLRDIYGTLYHKFKGRAWRFLDQSTETKKPFGRSTRFVVARVEAVRTLNVRSNEEVIEAQKQVDDDMLRARWSQYLSIITQTETR